MSRGGRRSVKGCDGSFSVMSLSLVIALAALMFAVPSLCSGAQHASAKESKVSKGSCRDWHLAGFLKDDNYIVTTSYGLTLTVYCRAMATTQPQTYLDLTQSRSQSGVVVIVFNLLKSLRPPEWGFKYATIEYHFRFLKARIDLETMQISTDDTTFVFTTTFVDDCSWQVPACQGAACQVPACQGAACHADGIVEFARAQWCEGTWYVHASVDLTGTPFAVDTSRPFELWGNAVYDDSTNFDIVDGKMVLRPHSQSMVCSAIGTVNGTCGGLGQPSDPKKLQLKLMPSDVPRRAALQVPQPAFGPRSTFSPLSRRPLTRDNRRLLSSDDWSTNCPYFRQPAPPSPPAPEGSGMQLGLAARILVAFGAVSCAVLVVLAIVATWVAIQHRRRHDRTSGLLEHPLQQQMQLVMDLATLPSHGPGIVDGQARAEQAAVGQVGGQSALAWGRENQEMNELGGARWDLTLGTLGAMADDVTPDVVVDATQILGSGGFGVVCLGQYRGREVAVKRVRAIMTAEHGLPSEEALAAAATLRREMQISSSYNGHPNFVTVYGGSIAADPFMVMERMSCSLADALEELEGPFDAHESVKIALDIARGLEALHPFTMHRDIKPSNILLDANGTAKIADLGLARLKTATGMTLSRTEVGTPCYMAPEVLENKPVSHSCDLFSWAIVTWQLLTAQEPWADVDHDVAIVNKVVRGDRPPFLAPSTSSLGDIQHLVHECWDGNAEKRPSAADVVARLEVILQRLHA